MVKKRLLEQDLTESGFPPDKLTTRCGTLGGSCEIYFNQKYSEQQQAKIENIVKRYTDVADISYKPENPITEIVDYFSKLWNK